MSNEDLQQLLYWMAGNMHIWVNSAVMTIAGGLIGMQHAIAILIGQQ